MADNYPQLIASTLNDVLEIVESEEDKEALNSILIELSECAELKDGEEYPDAEKVANIVKNTVVALAAVAEKIEDSKQKDALESMIKLLKSLPGYSDPKPTKKNNSEEVNKMEEKFNELSKELEGAKEDLENYANEVEGLKDQVIEQDKKLNDAEAELKSVTKAKDVAETELAKIAQEKKDAELMSYIAKEIEVGLTKEEDKDARLETLRKLSDDGLEVYTGMLEFELKRKDKETAQRQTLNEGDPSNKGGASEDKTAKEKELSEAKNALARAFGLKGYK